MQVVEDVICKLTIISYIHIFQNIKKNKLEMNLTLIKKICV